MKNKLQTILLFMGVILFLFISCNNYLVNGGIREYVDGLGSSNFTIAFDANGGEGTMNPQSVIGDIETNINANTFTHPDPLFKFVGWNTQANGKGTDYADKAELTTAKNITLYAQWGEVITITFDANGNGAEITGEMPPQTVTKDVPVALNANSFVRSGYGFVKWTTAADGKGTVYNDGETISITESKTLYAQWAEKRTITFVSPGSTVTMPNQIVLSGVETILNENVLTNPDPKFRFTGWTDQDGNKYTDKATVTITKDTTLTATWSSNFWTITFDGNGGVSDSENKIYQYVEQGDSTIIPANTFAKTDATFAIWNKEINGSGTDHEVGTSFTPSGDSTLFAQWDYMVTFAVDGGSPVEEIQVRERKTFAKPAAPTKEHFTFEGWYKEAEYTNVWDFDNDIVTGKTTLYAKWTAKPYTITFHGNDGDTIGDGSGDITYTQTVESGVKTKLVANEFTRTGYTFTGWNTVQNGVNGTAYTDEAQITFEAPTDLYAQWKEVPTITFNINEGTAGIMNPQIFKGDGSEEYIRVNTYTKTDHEFVGWNTVADGSGTSFADGGLIIFATSRELFAQWSNNYNTITFDGNGGTVGESGAKTYTQFVEKGDGAQLKPKTFVNSGKTFVGWAINTAGTGTIYENNARVDIINGNLTVYAQWGYTVSFDTDGGTEVSSKLVIADKFVSRPESPTKTDYRFDGWYENEGLTTAWDFDTNKVTADTTIYAKWISLKSTITFNKNGGEGSMNAQAVFNDVQTSLNENTLTRSGHAFTGWNTQSDGAGDAYADRGNITINTDEELFAQWAQLLTITFDANTGGGSMMAQTVPYSIATTLNSNTFTAPVDHEFIGWNIQSDGNGMGYEDRGQITITSDTTLFAQWDTQVHTITFNGNEGSDPVTNQTESTQRVSEGATIRLSANTFERAGYKFGGWNTLADGRGDNYADRAEITPTGDMTLYAHWIKEITITYHQNWGDDFNQSEVVNADTSITLTKNPLQRERYYFKGWNTQSDGGGDAYEDEEVVSFSSDTDLYAQWIDAPYSDSQARTIVTNGQNIKMVEEGSGSTIKWLYNDNGTIKEIVLADINRSYIANGTDISTYTIVNVKNNDGNYLFTGDHELYGGSIRGIEGMNSLEIQGNLTIGSNRTGGIVLSKDNQITITGALTGSDDGIHVRSHTIEEKKVIATVSAGENPISKLDITDQYGNLPLDVKYEGGELIALGQLGLTPSDSVVWDADGSFTIPEIALGVTGTIFSLSVENGTFTVGKTSIDGASFNMGIPIVNGKPNGYVESLTSGEDYSYIQFFPTGDTFPAENASDFVKNITFTPSSPAVEMSVKINLETVGLSGVNTDLTSINQGYVTYFNGSYYQIVAFTNDDNKRWATAYYKAKKLKFNNLTGYLMTITSKAENNFIFDKINVANQVPSTDENPEGRLRAWIGGTRQVNEHGYDAATWSPKDQNSTEWYWANGPEAGETFYNRSKYGNSPPGNSSVDHSYNNWNNPDNRYINASGVEEVAKGSEPNNGENVEIFAHYLESSLWNDFRLDPGDYAPSHFFVEFSVYGSQTPDKAPAFAEELYIKP